jgi:hypothetical protein
MAGYTFSRMDIEHIRGDVFNESFELVPSGVFSLVGKSVKAQLRENYDADPVLEFKTSDGSITIDNANTITLKKKASDMVLPVNTYLFDVQFYTSPDDTITLFGGKFRIINELSQ